MHKRNIFTLIISAIAALTLPVACTDADHIPGENSPKVPDGMVEVRPVLNGTFTTIPRVAAKSRTYDPNDETEKKLGTLTRLPEGATVWLIASHTETDGTTTYVKKSYAVYNPDNNEVNPDTGTPISYLVPCTVKPDGTVDSMESAPLYLKDNTTYKFSAISPARPLNEEEFKRGNITFKVKNGEAFYANDGRYTSTTPHEVKVTAENQNDACEVTLSPMINQTAMLRFHILKDHGVHNLDIQPSGIEISGLQKDADGVDWHMSTGKTDEPITLKHGGKFGIYSFYDWSVDPVDQSISIEVPVLPMYSISKPVIVLFRLKINGVPTTFEMMLDEKDFKAGYSYGYRGRVAIKDGIEVITWQFVSWTHDIEIDFNK